MKQCIVDDATSPKTAIKNTKHDIHMHTRMEISADS